MAPPIHLPSITIQHDLPTVLHEIQRGDHAAEDCYVSAYGRKPDGEPASVHGKVRLMEGDDAGTVDLVARDGVECERVGEAQGVSVELRALSAI